MSATVQAGLFDVEQARGKAWNGSWIDACESLDVTDPATGETLATIGGASPADIDRAAAEAARAQIAWAGTPADERAAVMTRAAELLEAHHVELPARARAALGRSGAGPGHRGRAQGRSQRTAKYRSVAGRFPSVGRPA